MTEPVLAYPCGTQVTVTLGGFRGIITCISIRFGNVTYEVSYYIAQELRTIWVNPLEIRPMGDLQVVEVAGFKQS